MKSTKTHGGFLLSQIRQLNARLFDRLLRESGVEAFNGPQGRILYVLWEQDCLTISEISRQTSLAKPTLTSMLDRMEKGGLILRTPDPDNRRQVIISLTEKAKTYRTQYDAVSDRMNQLFYAGFDEGEIHVFEEALRRILQNLQSQEDS